MTTTAGTGKTTYAGDDSTTAFPTGFKFIVNSHVKAILRDTLGVETTWVEATDYTLAGAGVAAGGTLTATTAPATGETLTLLLDVPFTQEKAFPLGGSFPSTQVEEMGDLNSMQSAKLSEVDNRTLKVPETDTQIGSNLDIPIDSVRASKFLAFDGVGKPIAAAGTSADLTPVSTYINTLLDDADAATARATLLAASRTVDTVFTAIQTFQAGLEAQSSDATAAAGPDITLARDSASAAAADLMGRLIFQGKNDNVTPQDVSYVVLRGDIVDPTDSSEDGRLAVVTTIAGAADVRAYLGAGLYTANATGGDQGADTVNTGGYYLNGQPVLDLQTEIPTTSGTTHDFTGIPSTAKRITAIFNGVSTNGISDMIMQLRGSGAFETSGYSGSCGVVTTASQAVSAMSAGFTFRNGPAAATVVTGHMTLINISGNVWVASGAIGQNDSAAIVHFGGSKTITGTLTELRITTASADTFDAGAVNIMIE